MKKINILMIFVSVAVIICLPGIFLFAASASVSDNNFSELTCGSDPSLLAAKLKQAMISSMEKKVLENLETAIQTGGCRYLTKYYRANSMPLLETVTAQTDSATQYSETNTQVQGVDEADFIKNDGSYIYIVSAGRFHIIDAWPPEKSHEISFFKIEGTPEKMFVSNSRAFIYSSLNQPAASPYIKKPFDYPPLKKPLLKITVLDISDVTKIALIREMYFPGSYVNSRLIGNAVHTVVAFPELTVKGVKYWPEALEFFCDYNNFKTEFDPLYNNREAFIRFVFEMLLKKNKALIIEADITNMLPAIEDISYNDGQQSFKKTILCNSSRFYIPSEIKGSELVSIFSTGIDTNTYLNSTTILGRPGALYASNSAFYVASKNSYYKTLKWPFNQKFYESTTVYKFKLNNKQFSSKYVGKGVVKGRILNQFSMDEYEDCLRIATTTGHLPSPDAHNTVSILKHVGGQLSIVGQIDNIAPSEDIRSVRFDKDKGFVVTFKKTDPLFVLDLSDPYNPNIAGELKIPGFSTYMHRIDDKHLLSIGYDAKDNGSFAWFQGIMLQIFDISNMKNPQLVHKEIIGTRGSTSDATANHLAFNYFKPKNLLAIPMVICEGQGSNWSYGSEMSFSGLMVYEVTPQEGFTYLGGVSHQEKEKNGYSSCSNWWTNPNSKVKRSIFMDDYVFSVTKDEIKVNSVSELGSDFGNDISVISLKDK